MTLDEARDCIGHGVVYYPRGCGPDCAEDGTITSVNDRFVFVRYRVLGAGVATDPADLTLLASPSADELAAKLAASPGYQAALQDAESESWDGPGIDGRAMIDAATERRRQWRAGLRSGGGEVPGDG